MYTKFIPKNIQEKLKAKERALAYKQPNALESTVKPIKSQDIQSRTTFVRMCSNKIDSIKNILIAGGKVGDFDGKSRFGLNEAIDGGDLYQKRKSGIRPVAGIKSIEVNYKGSYKAIREATVNWIVGSIEELDELTPYFLSVGKTVILDWGWVNSNVKNFSQMYNDIPFITWQPHLDGGRYNIDQSIFTDAQTRVQKMGGDYDALGGKVSNFEMTMRPDGGFDCVTKITALGSSLFAKPIDKPTNQISMIAKPMTDDEKELLKKGTSKDSDEQQRIDELQERITTDKKGDNLINALINLPKIIKHNVLKWPVDGGPLEEVIKNKGLFNFKKNKPTGKSAVAEFQNKLYHIKKNYAIAVDHYKNSQVCWMNIKGNSKFFVKWGYMEDQIMNRYLAYDAGEGGANDIKITFRSIKTRINGEGNPILTDKEALDNMPEDGQGTVLIDTDTPNTGKYTVVSNDTLSGIANRYGTTIDVLIDLNSDIQNSSSIINVGQEIILPQSTQEQEDFELLEGLTEDQLYGAGSMMLSPEIIAARDRSYNQFLSSLSNTYDIVDNISITDFPYTDKIPSADASDFQKESTKIRSLYRENNNFFYPIDPFKFWSPELLPPIERINHINSKDALLGARTEFEIFYKKLTEDPDKVFSVNKFTTDDNPNVGSLRNMWVNIEEIQKAFGIDLTSKDEPKANPPGTFENGMRALLQSLNSNFYGVWDFELAVDPYDSTNMGVIDKKVNALGKNTLNYTTFLSDVEGSSVPDREGNFSHEVSDLGIYKFPSFKVGSIVKNQNLSFKIPDSMALTILYGSNKPDKTETSNAAYNNPDLMKLFSGGQEIDDKYLMDMIPSNVSKGGRTAAQNVGSHKTNPNSKIVKDSEYGMKLTTNEEWGYKQWAGDTQEIIDSTKVKRPPKVQLSFEEGTNSIVEITEKFDVEGGTDSSVNAAGMTIMGAAGQKVVTEENKGKFIRISELPKLFTNDIDAAIFKIKKDVEKLIRSRLNGSLKIEENDFLKVDTIIPAELTLEIDGIGGISPGDLVHTDYIQKRYGVEIFDDNVNYGPYTYFQVFGLSQRVDSSNWSTELVTKMRINHIPDKENLKVSGELIRKEIPKPIPRPVIPIKSADVYIGDEVTLADLDFDDFSNLDAPPPPPPVSRPPTPVPSDTEVDIGALLKLDDSFNVLPIPPEPVPIPDIARPVIPVPTDNEDIFEYTKEEQDEIDNFGDEYLDEDFSNFEKPPKKVEKIVEKKKEKQKLKNSKKQKVNPTVPPKSTYKASLEQNSWYYQIREDWRTLYRKQSGTGINALSGAKQSYNPKQYQTIRGKQVEIFNIVREAQPIDIRRAWWDKNIEEPNESGESALTSLADIDVTLIKDSGFLRKNREIYWRGTYNPKFEG